MSYEGCPVCGAHAQVKRHFVGQRASFALAVPAAAVIIRACSICAAEARRQVDADNAAEVVTGGQARSVAVAAALT